MKNILVLHQKTKNTTQKCWVLNNLVPRLFHLGGGGQEMKESGHEVGFQSPVPRNNVAVTSHEPTNTFDWFRHDSRQAKYHAL